MRCKKRCKKMDAMWTSTSHPFFDLTSSRPTRSHWGKRLPVGRPRLSLEGSGYLFGDESVQPWRITEHLLTVNCAGVHQVRVEGEMLPNSFRVLCRVWV